MTTKREWKAIMVEKKLWLKLRKQCIGRINPETNKQMTMSQLIELLLNK